MYSCFNFNNIIKFYKGKFWIFWSWNIYDWYAWLTGFYTYEPKDGNEFNNHHRIRKTNEIFSIVASEVFYDNSKFENCYDMTNEIIKEKGIRYVHFDDNGKPLSKDKTKENGYNKFIGKEYVIPNEKQVLPLYAITLKRNEYVYGKIIILLIKHHI